MEKVWRQLPLVSFQPRFDKQILSSSGSSCMLSTSFSLVHLAQILSFKSLETPLPYAWHCMASGVEERIEFVHSYFVFGIVGVARRTVESEAIAAIPIQAPCSLVISAFLIGCWCDNQSPEFLSENLTI